MHCYKVTFNTLLPLYIYMQSVSSAENMSTARISNDVKAKLIKIGAKLSLKDGKSRSIEDIIKILIKHYEKDEKEQ